MEFAWNTQKNKMSDVKGKEMEQDRKGRKSNPDIDDTKTNMNYDLVESNKNYVERDGRHDDVDTRAVRQARIDNGLAFVDLPAGLRDELGDDDLQLAAAFKLRVHFKELAAFFNEDVLVAIDHDLGDVAVADDLPQNAKAADRLKDGVCDLPPLSEIQRG